MIRRLTAATAALVLTAPTAGAVPIVGGSGLVPNAWNLAQYIQSAYPSVQSIGGVRADPYPDHPSGRAIDIMVGNDTALGNTIYSDLSAQVGRWGIQYMIWQTDAAHYDHIHVTVD
jgi:hypothetical protein